MHVGEGAYDETEQIIMKLLAEKSATQTQTEKGSITDKLEKTDEQTKPDAEQIC